MPSSPPTPHFAAAGPRPPAVAVAVAAAVMAADCVCERWREDPPASDGAPQTSAPPSSSAPATVVSAAAAAAVAAVASSVGAFSVALPPTDPASGSPPAGDGRELSRSKPALSLSLGWLCGPLMTGASLTVACVLVCGPLMTGQLAWGCAAVIGGPLCPAGSCQYDSAAIMSLVSWLVGGGGDSYRAVSCRRLIGNS